MHPQSHRIGWWGGVGAWCKTKWIGAAELPGQNQLGAAIYNPVRMASLDGWRDAYHV